ncbi:MAG TPA: sugar phosphate isomerase/epimerase family protein [Candidatus Limnocylindrales bacterium]|jgi:sugar phosphate isomerase/epimerase|nr:sugar phosphate isomerase/epimerase family protein [Candidatus Limnocylindrales bacterium]
MRQIAQLDNTPRVSRRDFLMTAGLCGSAIAFGRLPGWCANNASAASPIAVFSKIYQELKLGFENAAEVTAAAGLDGIDCPVRAGGEILPENAAEQLPKYADVLGRRNLKINLLTTDITSANSPHAETVLRTAQKLGLRYYRFGFITREASSSADGQITQVRARLKELSALNKQFGMCTLLQNHSPSGRTLYFGGDLSELVRAVDGFDPAQIGVAFDIGHALVVHGDQWRQHFEALRSHFKIAYIKDVKRTGGWVPFGEGDIAATGYFDLLKQMNYHDPISLHIEFDWHGAGKPKTPERLTQVLKESAQVLRRWLA